jgi:hypothetical protein
MRAHESDESHSDCRYTMASKAGVDTSDVSSDNVRKMYNAAVKELIIPGK